MNDPANNYTARENQWDEQWPMGADETERRHPQDEPDALDEVSAFPDSVGTNDPIAAVRDAEPYMPPVDPPVLPGGTEGIHTGVGFGVDTEEEMLLDPQEPGEHDLDIADGVTLALRQDSLSSHYTFDVDVQQGVVTLRGSVPSVEDADHAATLAGQVPGVVDVVDETTIEPNMRG